MHVQPLCVLFAAAAQTSSSTTGAEQLMRSSAQAWLHLTRLENGNGRLERSDVQALLQGYTIGAWRARAGCAVLAINLRYV